MSQLSSFSKQEGTQVKVALSHLIGRTCESASGAFAITSAPPCLAPIYQVLLLMMALWYVSWSQYYSAHNCNE